MKAYKVEILIIDHDEIGSMDIKSVIENTDYPNWCISPEVKHVECADIGEWDDNHPLNQHDTCDAEYARMFHTPKVSESGDER